MYFGDLIELGSFTCHHVNDPSSTFISDYSLWGGFPMYSGCIFDVFGGILMCLCVFECILVI